MFREYELHGAWGVFIFKGKYLRELETKNWHYYEREDGVIIHLSKSGSHFLVGDTLAGIKQNRPSPPPPPSEEVVAINRPVIS